MSEAVRTVPIEYRGRKRLWINSGLWLGLNDLPYVQLSIQGLGYAERMLLEMEIRLASSARDQTPRKDRDQLLSECSAHSVLWIFGLYEVLRVVKEAKTPRFEGLRELFGKLENLRMPLAKHEVKRIRGKGVPSAHYPTGTWDPNTGRVGWIIIDPVSNESHVLTRTNLANEFLSIAAVEPDFPPAFPIGGPLGMDD